MNTHACTRPPESSWWRAFFPNTRQYSGNQLPDRLLAIHWTAQSLGFLHTLWRLVPSRESSPACARRACPGDSAFRGADVCGLGKCYQAMLPCCEDGRRPAYNQANCSAKRLCTLAIAVVRRPICDNVFTPVRPANHMSFDL